MSSFKALDDLGDVPGKVALVRVEISTSCGAAGSCRVRYFIHRSYAKIWPTNAHCKMVCLGAVRSGIW